MPKPGDLRAIDGVVAGIEGLAGAMAGDNGRSVYESQGITVF
jgi:hypothetical protein